MNINHYLYFKTLELAIEINSPRETKFFYQRRKLLDTLYNKNIDNHKEKNLLFFKIDYIYYIVNAILESKDIDVMLLPFLPIYDEVTISSISSTLNNKKIVDFLEKYNLFLDKRFKKTQEDTFTINGNWYKGFFGKEELEFLKEEFEQVFGIQSISYVDNSSIEQDSNVCRYKDSFFVCTNASSFLSFAYLFFLKNKWLHDDYDKIISENNTYSAVKYCLDKNSISANTNNKFGLIRKKLEQIFRKKHTVEEINREILSFLHKEKISKKDVYKIAIGEPQ